MDRYRPKRSPGSDRFLGIFSPGADSSGAAAGFELHEDELFGAVSPLSSGTRNPNPSPLSPSTRTAAFRRPAEGILAALPEEDRRRSPPSTTAASAASFLQRRPSISSSASSSPSASISPASSASTSSAARMIPAIPKPKPEYSLSIPGVRIQPQSAPVNIPVAAMRARRGPNEVVEEEVGEGDGDEDEMLPPHEIVAKARAKESPMTTFSVLEGAGRTLKGRDLRQVRNAIWRKTGFLD
ncbi:uncharacterized protein [Typha latifolia]|uniref:uncharacterized protein n=1 Tax=Typha latifolia TaxID=4733 RepID=UPI003C30B77B